LLARTRPTAASGNQALESNITEALHFLLLALHDAALSPDPDDLELLHALSGDRAEVIEKLRHQLLRQSDDRGAQIKETLYAASSLFERLVWLIRQYAQLLRTFPRGSV
jgi:phosphate:Na+ symporter